MGMIQRLCRWVRDAWRSARGGGDWYQARQARLRLSAIMARSPEVADQWLLHMEAALVVAGVPGPEARHHARVILQEVYGVGPIDQGRRAADADDVGALMEDLGVADPRDADPLNDPRHPRNAVG